MASLYYAAYVAYAALVVGIARYINANVSEPYMDEELHVPQAQAYCDSQWTHWDPLITTPPGLYLIPALLKHSSRLFSQACTLVALRRVNAVILIFLPATYSCLLSSIRHPILRPSTKGKSTPSREREGKRDGQEENFEALVIGLMPVLAFFSLLYYTDVASVALVMASYGLCLRRHWVLSAFLGGVSLLFRQTNVAWVAFIAGTAVVHQLEARAEVYSPPLSRSTIFDVFPSLFSLLSSSVRHLRILSPIVASYLPVFISFATFLVWNGGIVLGDKANHIPTVHIPQLYYFVAFSTVFVSPIILSPQSVRQSVCGLVGSARRVFVSLFILALMCLTIHRYTMSHAFLLADNRHYAFYIWRRVINVHPVSRYALAPSYLFAGRLLFDRLAASSTLSILPTLLYLIALCLTLVPSPLIEPRYFLTAYILLRLHVRPVGTRTERWTRLTVEALLYASVLAVTVWVFVERGFRWQGSPSVMRFMW